MVGAIATNMLYILLVAVTGEKLKPAVKNQVFSKFVFRVQGTTGNKPGQFAISYLARRHIIICLQDFAGKYK